MNFILKFPHRAYFKNISLAISVVAPPGVPCTAGGRMNAQYVEGKDDMFSFYLCRPGTCRYRDTTIKYKIKTLWV